MKSIDMKRWETLRNLLSADCVLTLNEPLAPKTTMRVGGRAAYYAQPVTLEDLRCLLQFAHAEGLPFFILGRGSNVIVDDTGYPGLVILLRGPCWEFIDMEDGAQPRVGAGVRLKQLCGALCREGLSGAEFLEGIPGSLGGALRMNAGAMNRWIFEVIESVRYMNANGDIVDAKSDSLTTGYRFCKELLGTIILQARFRNLIPSNSSLIESRMRAYSEKRKASQPREASAGCIFKNPPNEHAGRLIDELGLKGMRVGGAVVSDVHANFIVNQGGASSEDICQLIRKIRQVVKARKGIELEPEVLLLGKNREAYL